MGEKPGQGPTWRDIRQKRQSLTANNEGNCNLAASIPLDILPQAPHSAASELYI